MIKYTFRYGLYALGVTAVSLAIVPAAAQEAELKLGKEIFLEVADPPCAVCHTLADAEAVGEVGPILDDLDSDLESIRAAVVNGIGAMPGYEESLTKEQIDAVSKYVATAIRK